MTPRLFRLLAAVLLLLPALALHAAAAGYRFDTVHSQVLFSISHDGFSRPFGRLHIARGWLRFDADDWSHSSTALDIDLQSLDMGNTVWNSAVEAPSFLDAKKMRYAHFASTSVQRTDATHGVIHGQLTLRGVSRPVALDFTLNRIGTTIYGMHKVAGFSATTQLDRRDFGMTSNPNSIGEHVSVWLEIEAIADPAAGPASKSAP